MTDRIAELRALLDACRAEKNEMARFVKASRLADISINALPTLLDCAEALQAVTATLEWHAHGGCRATDGPIMSSADAVAMGKAALAALNGADNA